MLAAALDEVSASVGHPLTDAQKESILEAITAMTHADVEPALRLLGRAGIGSSRSAMAALLSRRAFSKAPDLTSASSGSSRRMGLAVQSRIRTSIGMPPTPPVSSPVS